MRHFLDRLYLSAGWAAAGAIFAIALLVSAQVLLNLATRVFGLPLPSSIPSYADFSGFLLAAATFLALPWTFRTGGHIRVSLLTQRMPERLRVWSEVAVLALAALLVGALTVYVVLLVAESRRFGDVSSGMVPVPLWIPQAVMATGLGLLLVAIVDSAVQTVARGAVVVRDAEEV